MRSIKRLGVALATGAAAFSMLGAPAYAAGGDTAAPAADIPAKTLTGLTHVAQERDYWCGPATAYILIKGMKHYGKISTTNSAPAGSALTQSRLAGSPYVDANDGNGTQAVDMRKGINKWIGHNWFNILNNPTSAEFKAKVKNNIGKGYGIAVATYEPANDRHYNNHPENKPIYHWVVARGYTKNLSKTHFVDPATNVWANANVQPYFSHYSNSFANLFVGPSEMIVW